MQQTKEINLFRTTMDLVSDMQVDKALCLGGGFFIFQYLFYLKLE